MSVSDLFSQIDAVATASSKGNSYFNWVAVKDNKAALECTIGKHRFIVVDKKESATAAIVVGNKVLLSHHTTSVRVAKEWCWRHAHQLKLIAEVKSVKVSKK